ncbi:MACRO domain-containing protein [Entamoeba marina]
MQPKDINNRELRREDIKYFQQTKHKVLKIDDIMLWSKVDDLGYSNRFDINTVLNERVAIYQGDITKLQFDAVVNAANSRLRGGGGVDGCIHSAAGYNLLKYLKENYEYCETGDFKPTPGFNMPCKQILHGVGPIGEHPEPLKKLYIRCMNYMKENKLKTIAFPCISTGIYGYSNKKACPVVLKTIRSWLEENLDWDGVIVFCCYSNKDTQIYKNNIATYFPKHTHEEVALLSYRSAVVKEKDVGTALLKVFNNLPLSLSIVDQLRRNHDSLIKCDEEKNVTFNSGLEKRSCRVDVGNNKIDPTNASTNQNQTGNVVDEKYQNEIVMALPPKVNNQISEKSDVELLNKDRGEQPLKEVNNEVVESKESINSDKEVKLNERIKPEDVTQQPKEKKGNKSVEQESQMKIED